MALNLKLLIFLALATAVIAGPVPPKARGGPYSRPDPRFPPDFGGQPTGSPIPGPGSKGPPRRPPPPPGGPGPIPRPAGPQPGPGPHPMRPQPMNPGFNPGQGPAGPGPFIPGNSGPGPQPGPGPHPMRPQPMNPGFNPGQGPAGPGPFIPGNSGPGPQPGLRPYPMPRPQPFGPGNSGPATGRPGPVPQTQHGSRPSFPRPTHPVEPFQPGWRPTRPNYPGHRNKPGSSPAGNNVLINNRENAFWESWKPFTGGSFPFSNSGEYGRHGYASPFSLGWSGRAENFLFDDNEGVGEGGSNYQFNGEYPSYTSNTCNCAGNSHCLNRCHASQSFNYYSS